MSASRTDVQDYVFKKKKEFFSSMILRINISNVKMLLQKCFWNIIIYYAILLYKITYQSRKNHFCLNVHHSLCNFIFVIIASLIYCKHLHSSNSSLIDHQYSSSMHSSSNLTLYHSTLQFCTNSSFIH